MANPSSIPHAIAVRGDGVNDTGQTVGKDSTSRIQVELRPGTYKLICPVASHEEAGITARLTVG